MSVCCRFCVAVWPWNVPGILCNSWSEALWGGLKCEDSNSEGGKSTWVSNQQPLCSRLGEKELLLLCFCGVCHNQNGHWYSTSYSQYKSQSGGWHSWCQIQISAFNHEQKSGRKRESPELPHQASEVLLPIITGKVWRKRKIKSYFFFLTSSLFCWSVTMDISELWLKYRSFPVFPDVQSHMFLWLETPGEIQWVSNFLSSKHEHCQLLFTRADETTSNQAFYFHLLRS